MPSLDQFKEKQKVVEEKRKNIKFQPKRYAPYLLQEEVIDSIAQKNLPQIELVEPNIYTDIHKRSEVESKNYAAIHSNDLAFVNDQVAKLYGIKRKLLFYFVELCNSDGGLITGPINSKTLIHITDSTAKTIKKIIQTMIQEKLVKRMKGKTGKGGFSTFLISGIVKQVVMEYKSKLNIKKLEETNYTNNNFKNSNRNNNFAEELPDEWKEINYKSLQNIGFSESQLKQIYNKKLNTPEIIQASIDHFSFGLHHNKERFSKYTDPLNVLMGVLRDGGRWIEKNYETPQEQTLRSLLEEKKQRKEAKEKLIKEILELEFPAWENKISEEEKKAIVPENIYNSRIKMGVTATLRSYFKEKILLPRLQEQGLVDL